MRTVSVWVGLVMLCAGAARAQIIGVDFGGGNLPPNWNAAVPSSPVMTNLLGDTGAATAVDLGIVGEIGGPFSQAINAATLPSHPYSLAGLDNYWFGASTITATFGDLEPGVAYRVWVFGLRSFAMNNRVTISGAGAPVAFDQTSTLVGNLWINDAVGSGAVTLADRAVIQTATPAGSIVIEWLQTPGSTSTGWAVAGVAIQPVPAPAAGLVLLLGAFPRRRRA